MFKILSRILAILWDAAIAALFTYFAVVAFRSGNDVAFALMAPFAAWALARAARDEREEPKCVTPKADPIDYDRLARSIARVSDRTVTVTEVSAEDAARRAARDLAWTAAQEWSDAYDQPLGSSKQTPLRGSEGSTDV